MAATSGEAVGVGAAGSHQGLRVEIVSRHGGVAWEGQASAVSVPLEAGEMGILPGRAPLLALLGSGTVRLSPLDGGTVTVPVDGGFCSVDHDTVTVAADQAGHEIRLPEGVTPTTTAVHAATGAGHEDATL